MKSQSSIMEHIFLIFFIVVIIVALIIFMSGFQFSQLTMEKAKTERDKALITAKVFMNSKYFVKESSIFDDGKLTAIASAYDCLEFEEIFGSGWFLEVIALDGTNVNTACAWSSYPNCNFWIMTSCGDQGTKNISYSLPINIYKATLGIKQLGVMKAGVYL